MARFISNLTSMVAIAIVFLLPGCSSNETKPECVESAEEFNQSIESEAIKLLEPVIQNEDLIPVIGQINIKYIYEYSWDADDNTARLLDKGPIFYLVKLDDVTNPQLIKVTSERLFLYMLSPGNYRIEAYYNPLIQTLGTKPIVHASFQINKDYQAMYIGELSIKLNYQQELLDVYADLQTTKIDALTASVIPSLEGKVHVSLMKPVDTFSDNVVSVHIDESEKSAPDKLGNVLTAMEKKYRERMNKCDYKEYNSSTDELTTTEKIIYTPLVILFCLAAAAGGYLCGT